MFDMLYELHFFHLWHKFRYFQMIVLEQEK